VEAAARVTEYYRNYLAVALFIGAALLMAAGMLGVGRLIRPSRPQPQKYITYEAGSDPIGGWGQSWDSDDREQNANGERKRLHAGPLFRLVLRAHALVYRASSLPANLRLNPRLKVGGGGGTLPVAFTAWTQESS